MNATSLAASNPSLEVSFSETMQQLERWPHAPKLAVACSGGADSLALTLLSHRWAKAQGGQLTALIVDHGLREESAAQAAQTAQWLQARDIDNVILSVPVADAHSGIQEKARDARYAAFQNWCLAHESPYLLTGHHADDQIETMLFRLLRRSGVHGLAGMSAKRTQSTLTILRPLLGCRKALLTQYLQAQNQPWIEDASNRNSHFARVRLRKTLHQHLDAAQHQRLLAVNHAFARLRHADEHALLTQLNQLCETLPYGVLRVQRALLQQPSHIAIWMLKRLLTACHGTPYPPRQQEVEQLYDDLLQAPEKTRSLHHCLIIAQQNSYIICREPARVAAPVKLLANQTRHWDHRFTLHTPPQLQENWRLEALGQDGLSALRAQQTPLPPLPHQALLGLPAIKRLEAVLILPHIDAKAMNDGHAYPDLLFTPSKGLADAPFFIMNEA